MQGGWEGAGNIDADPGFAFPGDLHLLPGSPCIDTGANDPPGGLPALDMEGQSRPMDGDGSAVADMGAYGFNPGAPMIAVSATEVGFFAVSGQLSSKPFSIRNSGSGTLEWTLDSDVAWLTAAPPAGQSSGEVDVVLLTADTAGLPCGLHCGTLWVRASAAANSSRAVSLVLHVGRTLYADDYANIQEALDAAQPADEVLLADRVYTGAGNRDLDACAAPDRARR